MAIVFQLLPLARWNICCCVFMLLFGNFALSLGRFHQNNVLKRVHVQRWKTHVWSVQTYLVLLIKYAKLYRSFCRREHHTVRSQYWFMIIFKIFSEFTCIWLLFLRKSTFFSSWLHPRYTSCNETCRPWYLSKCAVALYQLYGKSVHGKCGTFCFLGSFLMLSVCFSLFFSSPNHRQIPWKHIHWWRRYHHLRMRSHWIPCSSSILVL